jgi:GNAT superfamily N-acetyltransferase
MPDMGCYSDGDDDETEDSVLEPFSDSTYLLREAHETDSASITLLVQAIDMTNATSFVWPEAELRDRLQRRQPLTVLAQHRSTGAVVGVAGIDVCGMEKDFEVMSIGSRATTCPANETFVVPAAACLCRGLLVHPEHQGSGLGSRLHKSRMVLLAKIAPLTPCVVLSARGRTFEEVMTTLGPMLQQPRDSDATPQYDKSTIFQFTFPTSKGVVHLAHQRESEGLRFVGVDVSDGGPVWMTTAPLPELAEQYKAAAAAPARVRGMSMSLSPERRLSLLAPLSVRHSALASMSG